MISILVCLVLLLPFSLEDSPVSSLSATRAMNNTSFRSSEVVEITPRASSHSSFAELPTVVAITNENGIILESGNNTEATIDSNIKTTVETTVYYETTTESTPARYNYVNSSLEITNISTDQTSAKPPVSIEHPWHYKIPTTSDTTEISENPPSTEITVFPENPSSNEITEISRSPAAIGSTEFPEIFESNETTKFPENPASTVSTEFPATTEIEFSENPVSTDITELPEHLTSIDTIGFPENPAPTEIEYPGNPASTEITELPEHLTSTDITGFPDNPAPTENTENPAPGENTEPPDVTGSPEYPVLTDIPYVSEKPAFPPFRHETIAPETLPPETLPPETLPPETRPPETLPPETSPPETTTPDTTTLETTATTETNTPKTTSEEPSTPYPGDLEGSEDDGVNVGLVIGIILAILLIGVGLILWKAHHSGRLLWPPKHMFSNGFSDSVRPQPVPLKKFPAHCTEMLEIPSKLSHEYQLLATLSVDIYGTESFVTGQMPDNKWKNRYVNILPYDSTRVKLASVGEEDFYSDYINASYVKGYSNEIEYVATQGPKEETTKDFWKMVYQEPIKVIIMVTQLEEQGKPKCYKYYPNLRENMEFEDIAVRCTTELHFPIYTSRTLILVKGEKKRSITHLHFREWPDFGCPATPDLMLQFCQVMRHNIILAQPGITLIHCSAGVGRTGTLIAVDIILQHIKENKKIDIFGTVYKLRKHRMNMVQSETQYVYIYKCVKEALEDPSYLSSENSSTTSLEPIYENIECARLSTQTIKVEPDTVVSENECAL